MFTGIVQDLGRIVSLTSTSDGLQFCIASVLPSRCFKKGASIAVDGTCLTVERYDRKKSVFFVTAVSETLQRTGLGQLELGALVHLEPPLTLSDFIGGHLVSGHVDGLATVTSSAPLLALKLPSALLKFCPTKGSITVKGVSLTIAEQNGDILSIALVPETLKSTTLGELKQGDRVSIEVDLIARYLEHLYADSQ